MTPYFNRIIYMPLEPYVERYTYQMSAPGTGWFESNWKQYKIPYLRIDGSPYSTSQHINSGVVLDAFGRGHWAMSQCQSLLALIQSGEVGAGDCIYFDDFWHPGMEALQYAMDSAQIPLVERPRMYAFCWAQSVDQYDFTHPMREWMRHYEKGNGAILDGVFVTSTMLKELLIAAGISDRVHVVGLPFCSGEVKQRCLEKGLYEGTTRVPGSAQMLYRKGTKPPRQVIYTSRWDEEKDPSLFLEVAELLHERDPSISCVISTSAVKMRSNSPYCLEMLRSAEERGIVTVLEGLSKDEYYRALLTSTVQFNCALQDWTSWTLLEASACGCLPMYPNRRSFPESLRYTPEFMYRPGDAEHAASSIQYLMDLQDGGRRDDLRCAAYDLHKPFDNAWRRILHVMKGESYEPLYRR